jgi:hypothetical protein
MNYGLSQPEGVRFIDSGSNKNSGEIQKANPAKFTAIGNQIKMYRTSHKFEKATKMMNQNNT